MNRPIVVTLDDKKISLNLNTVEVVELHFFFADNQSGIRVHTRQNVWFVATPHDQAKFLAAWGMFRANVTDAETHRAEFTAIRERIIGAGMAIKHRKPADIFTILGRLTEALVRLVDVVEGER